jgi:hypothetical protein
LINTLDDYYGIIYFLIILISNKYGTHD